MSQLDLDAIEQSLLAQRKAIDAKLKRVAEIRRLADAVNSATAELLQGATTKLGLAPAKTEPPANRDAEPAATHPRKPVATRTAPALPASSSHSPEPNPLQACYEAFGTREFTSREAAALTGLATKDVNLQLYGPLQQRYVELAPPRPDGKLVAMKYTITALGVEFLNGAKGPPTRGQRD